MNSNKPYIISKLLSTFKKSIKSKDISTEHHPISPPLTPPLVDSAFASSCIKSELAWEDELEQIHLNGEHMESDWYHSLDKLTMLIDKVTSPFHNTNRTSLHCTQQFIEEYLDDWKSQRYHKDETYKEKIQQADLEFSDQAELKSCVVEICRVEQALYIYRHTMETQLTMLWNTKEKEQDMTLWKQYFGKFHQATSQMEQKFKDLLEKSTPKPDDYTCAVCLSIFTDPVTLHPCLHTFCKSCVQHIYCTCQLTRCDSSCHDTQDDNTRRFSNNYKPRYRTIILQQEEKRNSTVDLECDCPLSWSVPPAAQCPLCRHPFGPEDCTLAIGLDNLIRFYFPRQDPIRQKYHAHTRRLKRRHALLSLSQKCLPSGLPSVPMPPRRQPPPHHHTPPPSTTLATLAHDLASLATQSFIL